MSKQTIDNKYKIQRIEAIGRIIVPIVAALCVLFSILGFSYFAFKSIFVLSGKETTAKLLLNFFAEIKMDQWTAYLLAALSGAYGFGEHRQRKRVIRQKSERIQKLEQILNANRKSSMLEIDGSSRMGDVI